MDSLEEIDKITADWIVFKGKSIKELSREELIEVIVEQQKAHKRDKYFSDSLIRIHT